MTFDTEGPSGIVHLCREYTLPGNDARTRTRSWIRQNTKIGPVLNVHVCHHEDRYSIEIQVRSLFQNRDTSCVRTVNGIEKYTNETTETMENEEHGASGKPFVKARPLKEIINNADTGVRSSTRKKVGGRQSCKL